MFKTLAKIICVITICLFTTNCTSAENSTSSSNQNTSMQTTQTTKNSIDLSSYFENINGTAVFYTPDTNTYNIYNDELSTKQSSPCSTFKIFSTYVALDNKTIDPNNSLRKWNGTIYWYDAWNKDIDLDTAFKTSCVWYYRQVIDEIGQDTMQKYIDKFDYGNKDISDWDGKTNLDDDPRDLKGFWLETSLKISPLEQVQLLNRLFSANENPMALAKLKELMLVYEDNNTGLKIYGKTGYGVVNGENTDAWFTGFYEINNQRTYYSVRLDDPKNPQALSSTAKEIAINIIKNLNK